MSEDTTQVKSHASVFRGCERRFVTSRERRRHHQTHTGEKPFRCRFAACSQVFATHSEASMHNRRTHTRERPFQCTQDGSGKRFCTRVERSLHFRIHSGEKPFVCRHCKKRFARLGSRNEHEKKSHFDVLKRTVVQNVLNASQSV